MSQDVPAPFVVPPDAPKGRKTKCTPEVTERVCAAVRAGNYIEVAAAFAGVSKNSIFNWLKKGAQGDRRYKKFHKAVEEALAQAEVRDIAVIAKASKEGDWRAAAWRLERKNWRRWGKKDHMSVEGGSSVAAGGVNLTVNVVPANVVDRKTGHVIDADEIKELPANVDEED